MKKVIKFLPLVVLPSLIVVACANAQTSKTSQDTTNSNDNGITEYTVHVNFNGGTYEGGDSADFTVRRGVYYEYFKKTLPVAADIIYPNHELAYYSFADTPQTEIGDDYRFYGDVTIVAQYTTTGEEREITWENYDGTELAVEKYHDGEMPVYPGEEPTHDPEPGKIFTFAGWDPKIHVVEADQVYIAQFDVEVNESVVTFDTRGGNYIPATIVIYNGTILKAPKATRTGYVATDVWYYKDATGAEQTFKFGTGPSATKVTNDMTLYCKWEEVNKYPATFEPNGGTWSDEDTKAKTMPTEFGKIPSLGELTISKDGYTFAGWKRSDGGIGLIPITEKGETYTAQWNHNDCTVFFDTQGGSSVPSQTVAYDGTILEAPSPTREGYTLNKKWYYKPDGATETEFDFGDATTGTHVTSDITVYCKWTIEDVAITFNANEGTWSKTVGQDLVVNVKYGSIPAPDETLSRDGYTFKGWSPEIAPATQSTKYVAQWGEPDIYTVTFNSGEGSQYVEPVTGLKYGDTITKEPKTYREGYDFKGWWMTETYTEGTEFIFGEEGTGATPVTSNMTLYAKWDKIANVDLTFTIPESARSFACWHCDDDPVNDQYSSLQKPEFGEDEIDPTADIVIDNKHYVWTINDSVVLAGWENKDDGVIYKTIPAAKADTEYTAVIEEKPISTKTVTFYTTHDGTNWEKFLVEHIIPGGCVIEPKKEPTEDYEAHDFTGWYVSKEKGADKFDFTTPITEDTPIYAGFKDSMKITMKLYDAQGLNYKETTQYVGHPIKGRDDIQYWFPSDNIRLGVVGWNYKDSDLPVTIISEEDAGKEAVPQPGNIPFDFELDCVAKDEPHTVYNIVGGGSYVHTEFDYAEIINYTLEKPEGHEFPQDIGVSIYDSTGELVDEIRGQYYDVDTGTITIQTHDVIFQQIKSIKIALYENK